MLILKNINKKYKKAKKNAIINFSYQFNDIGLYILTGPSGSGKTTLLSIIAGIDNEYDGDVIFDDIKINKKNLLSYRNNISTIVFQDLNLIDSLNVEDNLKIAYEIAGIEYSKEKLIDELKKVNFPDEGENIDDLLKKNINELSGGQKQRIAIVRSLIRNSKVILLDEPTASLDEENAYELSNILHTISKTSLVIVCTHLPSYFITDDEIVLHIKNGIILENDDVINDDKILDSSFGKENGISILSSLKLSSSFLSHSKFKLVICCILCLISLVFFDVFSTGSRINKNDVLLNAQLNDGVNICIIDNTTFDYNSNYYSKKFSSEQKEVLKNFNAHEILNYKIETGFNSNATLDNYFQDSDFAFQVMELWDDLSNQFIQDERISSNPNAHFPKEINEVAISSSAADYIVSHRSYQKILNRDINNIIGFKIGYFTICNIYKTSDCSILDKMSNNDKNENYLKDDYKETYKFSNEKSYSKLLYASIGFTERCMEVFPEDSTDNFDPRTEEYYVFDCKGDKRKALQLLDELNVKNGSYVSNVILHNFYNSRYKLDFMKDETGSMIILLFILFFIVLTLLSLLILFTTNIKKEIYTYGILNALGCSKKSIWFTQFIQSSILGMILLFVTVILSQIAFIVINVINKLSCINFDFIVFLEMIGIIAIISLIISFVCYIKASKTNPKSLLNDK